MPQLHTLEMFEAPLIVAAVVLSKTNVNVELFYPNIKLKILVFSTYYSSKRST